MNSRRPRELHLAMEELTILQDCLEREETELAFLELHARALLNHILNAQETTKDKDAVCHPKLDG